MFRSPSKKDNFTKVSSNTIEAHPWTEKISIVDNISVASNALKSSKIMVELNEEDIIAAFTGLVKGYKDGIMEKEYIISKYKKTCKELEMELYLWKTGKKVLES